MRKNSRAFNSYRMGAASGNYALSPRRKLRPEDEELVRKRFELTDIQVALAERELELVDFQRQLAAFEGRYLSNVGTLYAELDEWNARICELQAGRDPSTAARQHAEEAREQAHRTHEAAHGPRSTNQDFVPSPQLKGLFREVAKRVHPDFSRDSPDLERRTRLMAEANMLIGRVTPKAFGAF